LLCSREGCIDPGTPSSASCQDRSDGISSGLHVTESAGFPRHWPPVSSSTSAGKSSSSPDRPPNQEHSCDVPCGPSLSCRLPKDERSIDTPHGVFSSTRTSDTPSYDHSYDVPAGASTATFADSTPKNGCSYDAPYTASATTFTRSAASSALSSCSGPYPAISAQEFSAASAPKPGEQYKPPVPCSSGFAATSATANKMTNPHQSTTYNPSPLRFTAYHSRFPIRELETPPPPRSSRTEYHSPSSHPAAQSSRRSSTTNASKYLYSPPDQNVVQSWSENSSPMRPEGSPPAYTPSPRFRQVRSIDVLYTSPTVSEARSRKEELRKEEQTSAEPQRVEDDSEYLREEIERRKRNDEPNG
jgi:hypothetical protein